MTKPFEKDELRARIQVGERILKLRTELAGRVKELQEALDQIRTLEGIVPICMYCKKIRDDQNFWQQVETYISEHSKAEFTHGLCPDCLEKYLTGRWKACARERATNEKTPVARSERRFELRQLTISSPPPFSALQITQLCLPEIDRLHRNWLSHRIRVRNAATIDPEWGENL